MGWRIRRSLSLGKDMRINAGKHGINSVTFGRRGMPHITTGKSGIQLGVSVPGTGVSYTKRIDGKSRRSGASKEREIMEDTNNQSATITSQQNKSVQMPASGTSSTSNVPPSVSSNTNPDGKKQPKMIKRKTFIIWLVIAILLSLFIGSSVSNSNSTDTNQTEELKSQLSQAKKKNTNLQNQINKLEAENKKLRSDNEANEQKLKADADARRKADESAQKKVTQEKQAANTPASTQQKQQNQTAPAPAPTKQAPAPAPASSGTVHGGSFCSTPGATGTSSSGSTLTCKTAKDGRLRWRR